MHTHSLSDWQHDHSFGQQKERVGERRVLIVVIITAITMVIEVAAGLVYGSMALLADGIHMATHTAALGISLMAYILARKLAHDRRYTFGTGKINALAGFASALLLAIFSIGIVWESAERLVSPVQIYFNQAIFVALLGLIVNGASAVILGGLHDHDSHGHGGHYHSHDHQDHNLKSAYLHVIADALTSVLAIFALLMAKYFGAVWLDPVMGFVGAGLIAHWAYGLMKDTSAVLLDRQADLAVEEQVTKAIESDGDDRVVDLHVWSIGPGIRAAAISVVTHDPQDPTIYRARLPKELALAHTTIEIHHCPALPCD